MGYRFGPCVPLTARGMCVSNRVQSLQPGDPRRIGSYRVVGRLGSGGMGTVFAALSGTGERMAVKVIHPAQAADDEFRARFRREVQLSQRVTGPCLIPVRDADTDAALPWLATPFIPGPTLDRHMTLNGPLTGAHLYALAAGTAAALSTIHAAGVVHRDVKPPNVILAPSGPQVLDFGIAHALDGTSVTRTGVMTGTPGWISPEHYRTGAVGPHGDVFAWGALVAYAATGRLPFGTGAADAVAFRVISAEPDLDGMPADLLPLVENALSKEPASRPSAEQLAAAAAELLAAQATAITTPDSGPQPTLIPDLISTLHWETAPPDEAAWPAPARQPDPPLPGRRRGRRDPRQHRRSRRRHPVLPRQPQRGPYSAQRPNHLDSHRGRRRQEAGPSAQPRRFDTVSARRIADSAASRCPLPRLHPQRHHTAHHR
ncbi:serine/threonine-protein kinase [Streptomyces sp. Tue6028]|uniref:serine/threonine-protein kinase n=1 Tax=Streptomyces sp. Tue6028 TaxID=2036037 RepID=UPI003EBE3161